MRNIRRGSIAQGAAAARALMRSPLPGLQAMSDASAALRLMCSSGTGGDGLPSRRRG
jgi:hypothetical protein